MLIFQRNDFNENQLNMIDRIIKHLGLTLDDFVDGEKSTEDNYWLHVYHRASDKNIDLVNHAWLEDYKKYCAQVFLSNESDEDKLFAIVAHVYKDISSAVYHGYCNFGSIRADKAVAILDANKCDGFFYRENLQELKDNSYYIGHRKHFWFEDFDNTYLCRLCKANALMDIMEEQIAKYVRLYQIKVVPINCK